MDVPSRVPIPRPWTATSRIARAAPPSPLNPQRLRARAETHGLEPAQDAAPIRRDDQPIPPVGDVPSDGLGGVVPREVQLGTGWPNVSGKTRAPSVATALASDVDESRTVICTLGMAMASARPRGGTFLQMLSCFRLALGQLVWWEEGRHKGKGAFDTHRWI